MPSTIIKLDPDQDWYVVWSTVVDAPTHWGARAEIERRYENAAPDRFARADATGTSAQWGGWVGPQPYSWETRAEALVVSAGNCGIEDPRGCWASLPYRNLRKFCDRMERGDDLDDLVVWEKFDDEPATHQKETER